MAHLDVVGIDITLSRTAGRRDGLAHGCRHALGEIVAEAGIRPLEPVPVFAQFVFLGQRIVREVQDRDERHFVGEQVVRQVGAGIVAAEQVIDLAGLALRKHRRLAEFDGQLVLLGIEDLQSARQFVEQFAARFGRLGAPLLDERLEIGLCTVFGAPEGGALRDAAIGGIGRCRRNRLLLLVTTRYHDQDREKEEETFHYGKMLIFTKI